MKKLLFLLLFIPLVSFSQNTVAFKDGQFLNISELISNCEKGFSSSSIKNNINTEVYCRCFIEKFATNFTYTELKTLILNQQVKKARLFFERNQEKITECMLLSSSKSQEPFSLNLLKTEEGRKQLVEFIKPKLIENLPKSEREWVLANANMDKVAICYVQKLENTNLLSKAMNNNLSPQDLQKIEDIFISCIQGNLKP